MAGVIADADQASIAAGGAAVGFINPAIYRLDTTPGAIQDIVSGGLQAEYRVDHAFTYIGGGTGFIDSFRELTYTGNEIYCDASGNCENAAHHSDSGTGLRQLDGARFDWTQLRRGSVELLSPAPRALPRMKKQTGRPEGRPVALCNGGKDLTDQRFQ